MYNFLKELLKDKTDSYSLREVVIAICMLLIVASWVAQLVFRISTPEYMFYSIVSLIAAGCFGYSIEKKPTSTNN
jgi:TctA family transporter